MQLKEETAAQAERTHSPPHPAPVSSSSSSSSSLLNSRDGAEGGDRQRCRKHDQQSALSSTAFRAAEKKYKLYQVNRREARRAKQHACRGGNTEGRNGSAPAPPEAEPFADVVDFANVEGNTEANRAMMHKVVLENPDVVCYTFSAVPGLLLFPGALTTEEQVHYCREAILRYGDSREHPNILSTHAKEPRETQLYQPPMRWATLGFSYQWTSKTYDPTLYSSFPRDVKGKMESLMAYVARVNQDQWHLPHHESYQPQTAIVNYYPVGAMMMCHQDISEETLQQPLVSLSFGCSAVFLMGTESRDDPPHAFLLRSGDVAAFTGPARTAFHATPRILDDCPSYLTLPDEDITAEERRRFANHAYYHCPAPDNSFVPVIKDAMTAEERERYWRLCMQHMRVNINARQVYSSNSDFLYSS